MNYGIHWFRRDLRLDGNPALNYLLNQCQGRVLGLFAFDSQFLSRPDFSHARFAFFLKTLVALRGELQKRGSDLWVLDSSPRSAFEFLLNHLHIKNFGRPSCISFNRDYEPFALKRDFGVQEFLEKEMKIPTHTESDHLLVEPHEQDRPKPYQVFTPFYKWWYPRAMAHAALETSEAMFDREDLQKLLQANPAPQTLDSFIQKQIPHVKIPIPNAGAHQARQQLQRFTSQSTHYAQTRDYPFQEGTSRLSIFFKNGSITSRQVLGEIKDPTFIKEIGWREFYYHILFYHPNVEHEAFNPKYRNLGWPNSEEYFEAWCKGETGYPIVDAGMRQLIQTGWMHNRVRMIVASFLTKDLLIDWKWGERFFMNHLLDGDLAPNNGGWQWAASTGCDAQPYFRIFNPTTQGVKFDPKAEYIRRFVPELAHTPVALIHTDPNLRDPIPGYAAPIVDHSQQRTKALQLFKKLG